MFLLHDLCFVLCSLDLDVQHILVQMIIVFFYLITHKSMRLEAINVSVPIKPRYHQKFRLRNNWQLFRNLRHLTSKELIQSQVAARLNGLAGGYGKREVIEKELSSYGLDQQTQDYIHSLLNKSKSN